MAVHADERGRRAPTPTALASLRAVPDGYRILPDPLHGQPLLRLPARPVDVRLLLDRSYESAQAAEPTQDYLVVRHDPRRLTFAVTDGVGSSFLGDVAAQILAASLSDWLAPVRGAVPAGAAFDEALTAHLHTLARDVAEQVAGWPIPPSVTALVRSALDQQRAYGSEAMFACGQVDLTGGRDATVTVAWLGDTRIRVLLRDGRSFDHGGQTQDRWSSRLGPRGAIRSRTWPLAEVARILACTDGVVPELDAAVALADTPLGVRLSERAHRPGNDDMALVDVGLVPRAMPAADPGAGPGRWRRLVDEPSGRHARPTPAGSALRRLMRVVAPTPAAATAPEPGEEMAPAGEPSTTAPPAPAPTPAPTPAPPPRPAPEPSTVDIGAPSTVWWRYSDRGRELTWTPVAGAVSYAVQLCREASFTDPLLYAVKALSFVVPPLPAPLYVRLASVVDAGTGAWGGVYDLSVEPYPAKKSNPEGASS